MTGLMARALKQVGNPLSPPRGTPSAVPPMHPETDLFGDAVAGMEGRPVAEIAQTLGITEREVRRVQADLGIEAP